MSIIFFTPTKPSCQGAGNKTSRLRHQQILLLHAEVQKESPESDKQRYAGTKAMDDAGKGIPFFQLVQTEAFGKQSLDMGNT